MDLEVLTPPQLQDLNDSELLALTGCNPFVNTYLVLSSIFQRGPFKICIRLSPPQTISHTFLQKSTKTSLMWLVLFYYTFLPEKTVPRQKKLVVSGFKKTPLHLCNSKQIVNPFPRVFSRQILGMGCWWWVSLMEHFIAKFQ